MVLWITSRTKTAGVSGSQITLSTACIRTKPHSESTYRRLKCVVLRHWNAYWDRHTFRS